VSAFAELLSRYIGSEPGKLSQREVERLTEELPPDRNGKSRRIAQGTISLILRGRTGMPEDSTLSVLTEVLELDEEEVAAAIAADRAASYVSVRGSAIEGVLRATQRLTEAEKRQVLDALASQVGLNH
jgi:hypothetical protein